MSNQTDSVISVTLNGERREYRRGITLSQLIEELRLKPDRLAVELDRRIAKPPSWEDEIRDGAEIEIVHFVGGG